MRVVGGLVVALSLAGCALAPSAWCDFRPREARCQESANSVSAEQFKGVCAGFSGIAGDGDCPTAGRVGGCSLGLQGDGSKLYDWYYPPETLRSVVEKCNASGSLFVAP
jgi:hypothetical protein